MVSKIAPGALSRSANYLGPVDTGWNVACHLFSCISPFQSAGRPPFLRVQVWGLRQRARLLANLWYWTAALTMQLVACGCKRADVPSLPLWRRREQPSAERRGISEQQTWQGSLPLGHALQLPWSEDGKYFVRTIFPVTSPMAQQVKTPCAVQETHDTWVQFLGQTDPLEKEIATHSNILAWEIPRTEKPGKLQSMGLQRVRHD